MVFVQSCCISHLTWVADMSSAILYCPLCLGEGRVVDEQCLVDWFKEAKRCPTCRERVVEKPTVSYLVVPPVVTR